MFQCASEAVTVLYAKTGARGAEVVGPKQVRERYGIDPELVPDFIALRGDPSDGIPGAKGVGEKTAADLLREHGSLEALLDNALAITRPKLRTTLIDSADELRDYKRMATLQDAGVKRPRDRRTDFKGGAAAARERGMNRLAERLEKIAQLVASSVGRAQRPVADPVARARPEARGAVSRVREPAALERQAATADALGEAALEPFELADPLIDATAPAAREPRPVAAVGNPVGRQLGELVADLLEGEADSLREDDKGDPAQDGRL